jgi:hypothetical protein
MHQLYNTCLGPSVSALVFPKRALLELRQSDWPMRVRARLLRSSLQLHRRRLLDLCCWLLGAELYQRVRLPAGGLECVRAAGCPKANGNLCAQCNNGWYGPSCTEPCDSRCRTSASNGSGVCHVDSGACVCDGQRYGEFCEKICETCAVATDINESACTAIGLCRFGCAHGLYGEWRLLQPLVRYKLHPMRSAAGLHGV